MVRLIAHNLLACPSKLCSFPNNYPLSFKDLTSVQEVDAEFNRAFLVGFLPRLEYAALRQAATQV